MKNILKRSLFIFLFLTIISTILIGCEKKEKIFFGTYLNENDETQKIIITNENISFENVDFSNFNSELHEMFGIDFKLNDIFKNKDSKQEYIFEKNQIKIKIANLANLSFDVINGKIILNGAKFIYNDKS